MKAEKITNRQNSITHRIRNLENNLYNIESEYCELYRKMETLQWDNDYEGGLTSEQAKELLETQKRVRELEQTICTKTAVIEELKKWDNQNAVVEWDALMELRNTIIDYNEGNDHDREKLAPIIQALRYSIERLFNYKVRLVYEADHKTIDLEALHIKDYEAKYGEWERHFEN